MTRLWTENKCKKKPCFEKFENSKKEQLYENAHLVFKTTIMCYTYIMLVRILEPLV